MAYTSIESWAMITLQLLVATVLGGLIGYQRETKESPAGFRTHILVCVGSAIYMLVSVAAAGDRFDPGRIAAQVASGIGFLGAGTIIKQGSIIRGLTTAASLWAVAGIGLAAGFGGPALGIALIGTLLVLLALTVLKQIERRFERKHYGFNVELVLAMPRQRVEWVQQILADHDIDVQNIAISGDGDQLGRISLDGRAHSRDEIDAALGELMKGEGIESVRLQLR